MSQIQPSDLLHGYDEIGQFLRLTAKQAEHRARAGEIPTFKMGRIVCARRSSLLAWMAAQEARGLHRGRGIEADREPVRAA